MTTYSDEPTRRQRQVLDFVQKSVEGRGWAPTLREIASHFGFSGTRAAEKDLDALEKKGRRRRGAGARAIELLERAVGRTVPIVGSVPAGLPMLAEENREGSLTLDPSVARWD